MARMMIKRWFWAWDFEEEEVWLNEMAYQGWALDKVGFCKYYFKSYEPGEYVVRLQMLENNPAMAESQEYIAFVEDTGAEYIGSVARWAYFRKKAADGRFELFSDISSMMNQLRRIINLALFCMVLNLLLGINALQYSPFGILNLALAVILAYGGYRLLLKKKRLEKKRILRE